MTSHYHWHVDIWLHMRVSRRLRGDAAISGDKGTNDASAGENESKDTGRRRLTKKSPVVAKKKSDEIEKDAEKTATGQPALDVKEEVQTPKAEKQGDGVASVVDASEPERGDAGCEGKNDGDYEGGENGDLCDGEEAEEDWKDWYGEEGEEEAREDFEPDEAVDPDGETAGGAAAADGACDRNGLAVPAGVQAAMKRRRQIVPCCFVQFPFQFSQVFQCDSNQLHCKTSALPHSFYDSIPFLL